MMMLKNKILLILGLFLLGISTHAQKATVTATVQPSDILIGEQAVIDLQVIVPKGRDVIFPLYIDTLVTGIEVLDMLPPDTLKTEIWTISQKYLITSFDSMLYHIPYMEVIDGNDTIRSNDFGFKVSAPQLSDATLEYLDQIKTSYIDTIDLDKLGIHDIKPIMSEEFVWTDYLEYFYIPLLLFLIFSLIVVIYYFITKKKKKGYFFTPKVVLPPHLVAITALENLKSKKLIQAGQLKEFHTEITDILREYIKERFGINAPEMLTEDIIQAVRLATDGKASTTDGLKQILTLADLVKFARFEPLQNENDLSLMNAYLFVNQTKQEELKFDKNGNPVIEDEVKEDINSQKIKK